MRKDLLNQLADHIEANVKPEDFCPRDWDRCLAGHAAKLFRIRHFGSLDGRYVGPIAEFFEMEYSEAFDFFCCSMGNLYREAQAHQLSKEKVLRCALEMLRKKAEQSPP